MEHKTIALPSKQQQEWQDMEMGMFCHFGLNTFCDQEWGEGTDSPALFNPSSLDAGQWVRTAKEAGFRYFILTAKHHDGFCLWPTKTTDYSVKSSPWKDGRGDVVKECAEACRREGMAFGLYLSPWDRHEPRYSDPAAYNDFYIEQLSELLTGYGPLVELWFDGAGSEGREYDWRRIVDAIKQYQPDALMFNMGAPTIRWVGNEDGTATYPCWNEAKSARTSMFTQEMLQWLPETPAWVPAECDVPIREKHWFWHPNDEGSLKSLDHLMDVYERSVGHGCTLLLNVAPDDRGLFPDADVQRVREFGEEIRRRFGRPIVQSSGDGEWLSLTLQKPQHVQYAVTMEDIAHGERVRVYTVEAWDDNRRKWTQVCKGSAIGHKKIDRFEPVTASRFRLHIEESVGLPKIRSFAIY